MEQWVNPVVYLAYVLLTIGIVAQIWRTALRKTADDIEILEVVGRSLAHILIMWKMILVADMTLVVGHAIITVVYLGYFCLVLRYKYFA